MATLWIEEYNELGRAENGEAINAPHGVPTNQQVAIGASSAQSSAFASTTEYVRIHADTACYVKFGTNPTAAANSTSEHLMANSYVDRSVPAGSTYKVAVITA